MSDVSLRLDRDDAACLAPILRGRLEELEHAGRLRAHLLTDFDQRADRRYANRIRNCLSAIEEAVRVGRDGN
ncbi:hypothetical protein [Afipia felis]|uniref:Uncharacterized protein n=2 Tax=Afipia felis TaxID=1035 RepID=A0A381AZ96_AFIFE|nr:hypothetical protein [Afipia felis]EKS26702.1 hypothetical protein HMPREF9697_04005 [Afipia felis ATCC 53690]SUU76149.1 Uncharacterised protein [Afipia felis]SUU84216.1 Uncharacterised protein [Afipia felis]SUW28220.1 Uncharacterised protein [Afipia felis]